MVEVRSGGGGGGGGRISATLGKFVPTKKDIMGKLNKLRGKTNDSQRGEGHFAAWTPNPDVPENEIDHGSNSTSGGYSLADDTQPPLPARPGKPRTYVNDRNPLFNDEDSDHSDGLSESGDEDDGDDGYALPPSLLEQGSVLDVDLSRDQLLEKLQNCSNPAGTFLIRKSRKDNRNVLTVHAGSAGVKELKIYEANQKFTIDNDTYFKDTEDLLRYYNTVKFVPKTNVYLQKGIRFKVDI